MEIRDKLISGLRTLWPYAIGQLATWLIAATGALGLELDSAGAVAVAGWVVGSVVYLLGRWLEGRRGMSVPARVSRFVGALLLGSSSQPVYAGRVVDGYPVVEGQKLTPLVKQ